MPDEMKILVVDDHELIGAGVEKLLASFPYMRVVSILDPRDLIGATIRHEPDLILLDYVMDGFDVYEGLARLRALRQSTRHRFHVVIISAYLDLYLARQAEGLGVSGYLLKEETARERFGAILLRASNGEFVLSPLVRQALEGTVRNTTSYGLSEELFNVLCLMVQGRDDDSIAEILSQGRNRESLEKNRKNIVYKAKQRLREKLGVSNDRELIVKAICERIVPLE